VTVPTTIDADAWLSKYLEGADGGASRSGSGGPLTLVDGVLGTHRFARVGGRPPQAAELSLGSNLTYMVRFV
jgi:hypothetical protein